MKNKKETFSSLMNHFGGHRDLHTVFSDFLKLTICAFSRDYKNNISYLENEYLEIIQKYKKPIETDLFPKLLGTLIIEMEEQNDSQYGSDILGNYFETHITNGRNGQFFTPTNICDFMASITSDENESDENRPPLHILDPACGSGRMLLSKAKIHGKHHYYYGIDIDRTCVEMSIINLFLNGIFHTEVMCANALSQNDFQFSYYTSFLPLGIYRITEKTQSRLWNMHQNSFNQIRVNDNPTISSLHLPTDRGEQMSLF